MKENNQPNWNTYQIILLQILDYKNVYKPEYEL